MAETMPPASGVTREPRRFYVARPSMSLWRAVPIDDEFRAYFDEMRRFLRRRHLRGEVACFNKHQHLDVYGGSCDDCAAAV